MEAKQYQNGVILVLVISVLLQSSYGITPTTSSCTELTDTSTQTNYLQSALVNITSNTVLSLSPGCHQLTELTPIIDKTNVSIEGQGPTETVITCDGGIGLVFLNVIQLRLLNVSIVGCGLNGTNLDQAIVNATSLVPEFSMFSVSPNTNVGLLIADAINVSMNGVHVNDTKGIGVLAINVLGEFTIEGSIFSNNTPGVCERYRIGGGLLVTYHNSTNEGGGESSLHNLLSLEQSQFLFNSHCSQDIERAVYRAFSLSAEPNISIIAGGGLTVLFSQKSDYSVNTNVNSCTFRNNSAPYGGGLFVGLFYGTQHSNFTVSNSLFLKNGRNGTLYLVNASNNITNSAITSTYSTSGQGIAILAGLPFPVYNDLFSLIGRGRNFILIQDSVFTENIAVSGGAFLYFSRHVVSLPGYNPYRVSFKNCSFTKNRAYYGGAVYLTEEKATGAQEGTSIFFEDCNVTKNQLISTNVALQSSNNDSPSIVTALALNMTFAGNNMLSKNDGTPFSASRSVINIFDNLTFSNNNGVYGGGLALSSSSFIVLHSNSVTSFINNTAFLYGGAIFYSYINTNFYVNYFDCFIYFNNLDIYDNSIDYSVRVNFINNIAPSSGATIYGSTLNGCSWNVNKTSPEGFTVYRYLTERGVFEFNPSINDNTFSTATNRFEVSGYDEYTVMPGEELNVNTIPFDYFQQNTSELIYAKVDDNVLRGPQQAYFSDTLYWFIHTGFTNAPLIVRAMEEPSNETIVPIKFFSVTSGASVPFNVTIRSCYPGFEFQVNSTYKTCVCSETLTTKYQTLQCDPKKNQFTVPSNLWIGQADSSNEKSMLVGHTCLFDYCTIGVKNVSRGNFDTQCKTDSNRTGLLCGQCKENYSIIFGSNDCRECSNYDIFLLLYFIIGGFSIITSIGRMGITVSHGFLNSIVFYSNIVVPFQSYLVYQYDNTGGYVLLFIFSSINLTMGYPACFYDGMTTLARTYLNFVFPFYLWLLLGLYTILARFETFRKRWLRENGAAVFASIMLISYISTLQACTLALSVVHIDGASPPWRWAPDPSVVYFGGDHAALGVLSIVLVIFYIIPAPLMTMFPSITLSTRFGKRFIPVYDAFWAPFRERFHFWIGFRLFLRIVPFLLANFASYPLNTILLGVFTVVLLFIHVLVQPYKGKAQNLLDTYLLLNIILLVMGSLFTEAQIEYFETPTEIPISIYIGYQIMVYFILIFALIPVFFVYCYHIYIRFPSVQNCWKKLIVKLTSTYKKVVNKVKKREERLNVSKINSEASYGASQGGGVILDNALPVPVTYSELREPLLEEGQLSLQYKS